MSSELSVPAQTQARTPFKLLFLLMLKEEWRLNLAFASRRGVLMYPLLIFVGGLASGASLDQLTGGVGFDRMLTGGLLSLVVYGLFVGSFTFFGKEILERLFGATSMLLGLPSTQPLSNRATLLLFFAKDTSYYMLTNFIPLTLGLMVGGRASGLAPVSVGLFAVGATATFATGLALAFLLAGAYMRHPALALALGLGLSFPFLAAFGGLFSPDSLLPALAYHETHALGYLGLAWLAVGALALLAAWLMPERYEQRQSKTTKTFVAGYAPLLVRFGVFGRLDPLLPCLLAKEWLDVFRSRVHYRMVFSLAIPLLMFTGLEWFLLASLPPEAQIDFNVLFYGGLVGFMTVMLYSWLNNLDNNGFYATLPVLVSQVVRAKIALFLLLTSAVPVIYLFLIGALTGELNLLPLALILLFSVSIYTVAYAAMATGLRTNSYLFDTVILLKFQLISALPLMAIVILSDLLEKGLPITTVTLAVLVFAALLLVAAAFFWSRIERKWAHEEFG